MSNLVSIASASGINLSFGTMDSVVAMFGLPWCAVAGLAGYIVFSTFVRR